MGLGNGRWRVWYRDIDRRIRWHQVQQARGIASARRQRGLDAPMKIRVGLQYFDVAFGLATPADRFLKRRGRSLARTVLLACLEAGRLPAVAHFDFALDYRHAGTLGAVADAERRPDDPDDEIVRRDIERPVALRHHLDDDVAVVDT